MSNLLSGKTALILGVANKWSIAYAIAKAFHREGANIILTYQGERLKANIEETAAEFGGARVMPCDVTIDSEIDAMAAALKESGTKLDIVVHSIAYANKDDLMKPFMEVSRDGFLLAQNVSAYSLVAVSRACAPLMTANSSIMTLTYLGSTRVITNYNVMGVAKASLEACVRYLANDLGPQGVRVNAISAGAIKTAAARGIKDFAKLLEGVSENTPLRHNTDPAEVADTAVFLGSDLARGVTGNCIFVDSGYQILGV